MPSIVNIRWVEIDDDCVVDQLSDVLIDCAEGGASVSFMLPLSRAKAETFWRSVLQTASRGERAVLVAEDDTGSIVGAIQVLMNQPENQPHAPALH